MVRTGELPRETDLQTKQDVDEVKKMLRRGMRGMRRMRMQILKVVMVMLGLFWSPVQLHKGGRR